MRITILILGFGLGAVMFVQTFLVYSLSSIGDDTASSRAATAGLGMVVLWLFAVAFVFGTPWLSIVLFGVAGLVGIGNAGNFPDLQTWGITSFVLAGLSIINLRQVRGTDSRHVIGGQVAREGKSVSCPGCGATVAQGTRFCSSCGFSLASHVCPSCSNTVSPGNAFCGRCGEPLAGSLVPASLPETARVEEPKTSPARRIPVLLALCILAVAQVGAWVQSGGTFGYGNYLGAAVILGGLGWFIYWVKLNGRGGIEVPGAVWTILGPHKPPSEPSSQAVGNMQPRFPSGLVAGVLILAAAGSIIFGRVDDRHRSIRVIGSGMGPTLADGSLWTVAQHAYTTTQPSRGDVVVYADSGAQGQSVKRVVGLPGEHLTIEAGKVKIDGEPISEPYIQQITHCSSRGTCDIVLDDNEVFVMGDNRSNAADSRSIGPVDIARIRGKIIKKFWPLALPWDQEPLT